MTITRSRARLFSPSGGWPGSPLSWSVAVPNFDLRFFPNQKSWVPMFSCVILGPTQGSCSTAKNLFNSK